MKHLQGMLSIPLDLYSNYDQFEFANESKDLTTMETPLELIRMCTLLQDATNLVVHIQRAMNNILRDFVLEKTIPFVNAIPIKGCNINLTMHEDGCIVFVKDHVLDVVKVLEKLEDVGLTLSIDKSKLGVDEILVVENLCLRYGRKPKLEKVYAIYRMKACGSIIEVRRSFGKCVFWMQHSTHVAHPLYKLLKKGTKFK